MMSPFTACTPCDHDAELLHARDVIMVYHGVYYSSFYSRERSSEETGKKKRDRGKWKNEKKHNRAWDKQPRKKFSIFNHV